jgi:opacity protein-like surface antigen
MLSKITVVTMSAAVLLTAATAAQAGQSWNGQGFNGQGMNGQGWNGQGMNGIGYNSTKITGTDPREPGVARSEPTVTEVELPKDDAQR